jgi:hypothetical protein
MDFLGNVLTFFVSTKTAQTAIVEPQESLKTPDVFTVD